VTKITRPKSQLKAWTPDIIYISAGPDEIGTIVKQFRDAGIDKPIVGGDGYDTPLLIEIAGASADNVYFTTHSLMDADLGTDPVKNFIKAYEAEYKNPPENAFAGLGYDTIKLIGRDQATGQLTQASVMIQNPKIAWRDREISYQPGVRPRKGLQ
jgi:ABC-type branched-subunit amino acid transport system substrate-binding protein